MLKRRSVQYEGRAPKRVRTLEDSMSLDITAIKDIEMGWCPFRIVRIMEKYKTIGKGYVETTRYELLFGFNNCGKNFQDGNYVGPELDLETFIDEFVTSGSSPNPCTTLTLLIQPRNILMLKFK